MTEIPKEIYVIGYNSGYWYKDQAIYNLSLKYIRADIHDRRVTELLEANNRLLERARIAEQKRQARFNINQISVGDTVTYRGGAEGIVTNICEKVFDGINHPHTDKVLAHARIFTNLVGGGRMYITHRADGVSHDCEATDIIYSNKAAPSDALSACTGITESLEQQDAAERGKYSKGGQKLWDWFGISRASFIVLPRVLAHEMSSDWQGKMADLLEEFDETFTNLKTEEACFTVRSTNGLGKIIKMPDWLKNYRHPDKKQIERAKRK